MLNIYFHFIELLQKHLFVCPFKAFLHIDCPGCGMQRAIIALLKGDICSSLHYHPAAIPLLALLLFLVLHLRFPYRHGSKVLIALQLSVIILSLSFYTYKIIHHQIG